MVKSSMGAYIMSLTRHFALVFFVASYETFSFRCVLFGKFSYIQRAKSLDHVLLIWAEPHQIGQMSLALPLDKVNQVQLLVD